MNAAQVTATRQQINVAHDAGDMKKADKLQAKLHAHFTAQSEQFVRSAAGQDWTNNYLMNRA